MSDTEIVPVRGFEERKRADLNNALNKLLPQTSPQQLSEYLYACINQKILLAEARKRGINRRKDILDKTESFKKQLVSKTFGREILDDKSISDSNIENY